jgi:hypothetical protein
MIRRRIRLIHVFVVYKINSADWSWGYIGETGRAFETRKKEHKTNVQQCKSGSNIAKHAWTQEHKITEL